MARSVGTVGATVVVLGAVILIAITLYQLLSAALGQLHSGVEISLTAPVSRGVLQRLRRTLDTTNAAYTPSQHEEGTTTPLGSQ